MPNFWGDAFKIAVLLNPFAVLSTFMALAGGESIRVKKRIVAQTCMAALVAGIVVLFSGEVLFALLGVNIDLFKTGGGVVLMVCAVSLVWGRESASAADPQEYQAIAVVPLAIPMAVGPGTAAGLMIIGLEHGKNFNRICSNLGALAVGIVILAAVLSLGIWSNKVLPRATLSIITRLTGLFLSAIAAQMILEGIKHTFRL